MSLRLIATLTAPSSFHQGRIWSILAALIREIKSYFYYCI